MKTVRTQIIKNGKFDIPDIITEDISFELVTGWKHVRCSLEARKASEILPEKITITKQ